MISSHGVWACAGPLLQTRSLSSVPPLAYRVIRNSRGSLPVYTELKSGGRRRFVLVRNVEGDASALLQDLRATLFPPGSDEAAMLRGEIIRSKHLKLQGPSLSWRANVEDWLRLRGF